MTLDRLWIHVYLLLGFVGVTAAGLPPRAADAVTGIRFSHSLAALSLAERETEIRAQFAAGNVPDFWRRFVEVKVARTIGGLEHIAIYHVAPDYLAIGSDADYFLTPVTPATAQSLADKLDCTLPTRRMVDDIYAAAAVKLTPSPLPPGPAMTTVPVFQQHNEIVRRQRGRELKKNPAGTLTAGHKKDVVLTPQLATAGGKVAIYGWHRTGGRPIQPLYTRHTVSWVDYSHGARFVRRALTVDGEEATFDAILADAALSALLSDEGPFPPPRYTSAAPLPGEHLKELTFPLETPNGYRTFTTPDDRVTFLVRENPVPQAPEARQAERNGFIHSVLTGIAIDENDYRDAPRDHSGFIAGGPEKQ